MQAKTTGWVGIGFPSTVPNKMENADIIMGYVTTGGEVQIDDWFSSAAVGVPTKDASYDLLNVDGWEEDGWTSIQFQRLLISTDTTEDVPIDMSRPFHIIAAFGTKDSFSESHSITNRGTYLLSPYSSLENYAISTNGYQSLNGTGNNVDHPDWGATGDVYIWKVKNYYDDGISAPAGPNRPPSRNISNALFSREDRLQNIEISALLVYFGQLLAHDVSMTSGSSESWPIEIPKCDPTFDIDCQGASTMGFSRSAWLSGTGSDTNNPRMQTNGQTSFMDASHVYGQSKERSDMLRTMSGGKMILDEHGLLPNIPSVEMASEAQCPCNMRAAGDARANVHSVLFSMHTIFVREHNRWCDILAGLNPNWNDETLYQEARRRVIAIWQKISMYEYLPAVLGRPPKLWEGYDKTKVPRLTHEFNVCAFRYGHSELPSTLLRYGSDGHVVPEGHLSLQENLFNARFGMSNNKLDPLMRGVCRQNPGKADLRMVPSARNFLFGNPRGSLRGAFDLASRSIQRGRDHGISDYAQARLDYGLSPITKWEDINPLHEDLDILKSLFPDINDIDLYIGGLAEPKSGAAIVGELYAAILEDDFTRIRDGDRFWFENGQFSDAELQEILDTRLADVVRRNTDLTELDVPDNMFFVDKRYTEFNLIKEFPTKDGFPDTRSFEYTNELVIIDSNYKMLWSADTTKVDIMLQVKTEGWVGIGFNPDQRGIMRGADMIIARILDSGVEIKDYKAIANVGKPKEDIELEGVDNLENLEGWKINGWTVVKFSRNRDTGDTIGDHILKSDVDTYTIFAYQKETTKFHYHGQNVRGMPILFRPSQVEVEQLLKHDETQLAIGVILAAIGILLTLLLILFQAINRKKPTIVYSSPAINNIMFLGAILCYSAIPFFALGSSFVCSDETRIIATNITFIGDANRLPTAACKFSGSICTIRKWLLSLGFTLVFSSMFSKTYRVHRILVRSAKNGLKKVQVKNSDLFKIIGILTAVDMIILLLWSIADPFEMVRTFSGVQKISPLYYEREVVEACQASSDIFWAITFGYKGILLLLSAFMANATKNVEIPDMRDFQSVGIATYSIVMICFVVLPALSVLESDVDASFTLSIGSIFLTTTSTLLILYIPKIQDIYFGTGGNRSNISDVNKSCSQRSAMNSKRVYAVDSERDN